jgi:hypothetical protein
MTASHNETPLSELQTTFMAMRKKHQCLVKTPKTHRTLFYSNTAPPAAFRPAHPVTKLVYFRIHDGVGQLSSRELAFPNNCVIRVDLPTVYVNTVLRPLQLAPQETSKVAIAVPSFAVPSDEEIISTFQQMSKHREAGTAIALGALKDRPAGFVKAITETLDECDKILENLAQKEYSPKSPRVR